MASLGMFVLSVIKGVSIGERVSSNEIHHSRSMRWPMDGSRGHNSVIPPFSLSPEQELYASGLSATGWPNERYNLARPDLQVETAREIPRTVYL